MRILLLFLDGVGIGSDDPAINPFFAASLPTFRSLLGGSLPSFANQRFETREATLVPLDVTFGIKGLPQSGTGQMALFTGAKAPVLFGRHFGPYPPVELRDILEKKNLFKQFQKRGRRVSFVNAYPRQFFQYVDTGTLRLTVTTLSCLLSGVPLRQYSDLIRGRALSSDIINARWRELGYEHLPIITPETAGKRLARLVNENFFTLFEFYLTDHAGHSQERAWAIDVLERYDRFLAGLLKEVNLRTTLVVLTSDHGNIEDLSTRTHTSNPVPLLLVGRGRKLVAKRAKTIADVAPALLHLADTL